MRSMYALSWISMVLGINGGTIQASSTRIALCTILVNFSGHKVKGGIWNTIVIWNRVCNLCCV